MNRTTPRLAIFVTVALVAAACSGGGDDDAAPTSTSTTVAETTTTSSPTTTSSSTSTSTTSSSSTTTTEPEPEVVLRMPLTGEVIESADEIPDRPALAVKIDNNPRAHPQAGLNDADIVYEEIVEFGTRFAAVFHTGDSDPLGPIRSGRSQDVGILTSLDRPLFAWSGGNANVRAIIRGSELVDLDAGFSPGYYRRSGRGGAPHNLFSSTEALWLSTPEDYAIPPQQFPYLPPGEEPEGAEATVVELVLDGLRVRWDYDPESETYLRSERGSPHMTEADGQVSTDNIVVMAVDYQPSAADRRSPEAQVLGSGPVFVFSRGTVRPGHWVRFDIHDPFTFVDELPEADEVDGETGDGASGDDSADGESGESGESGDDEREPGVDPFTGWDLDVDLVGLVPGRTWVELARDAENFVTWE